MRASGRNWKPSLRAMTSAPPPEDTRTWIYAFVILLIVSLSILTLRLLGNPFLAADFEIVVVYSPTALAGFAAIYSTIAPRNT